MRPLTVLTRRVPSRARTTDGTAVQICALCAELEAIAKMRDDGLLGPEHWPLSIDALVDEYATMLRTYRDADEIILRQASPHGRAPLRNQRRRPFGGGRDVAP